MKAQRGKNEPSRNRVRNKVLYARGWRLPNFHFLFPRADCRTLLWRTDADEPFSWRTDRICQRAHDLGRHGPMAALGLPVGFPGGADCRPNLGLVVAASV